MSATPNPIDLASLLKSSLGDFIAPQPPPSAELQTWLAHCYYDRARKENLILDDKGDWYSINETQLRRQCKVRGMEVKGTELEPISAFDHFLVGLQNNRGIHYAGPLAGHGKGWRMVNGVPILVTASPLFIEPVKGDWPILRQLLTGMFEESNHRQLAFFFGWMKVSLEALTESARKPGQVLVLAGQPESGKSLLQSIITWCLGGRECKPYGFMTGTTDFNSDLFGSEHLRLDDEQASTDMRARRALGARIKGLLFGHPQRLHAKHRDAITLDPIWRMTISLNEEPESMQVLPPLDESLEDKLIILRVNKRPMPMPTGTTEESEAFGNTIRSELPAFVHYLTHEHKIETHLRNERCGIRHWHHPDLLMAIKELSAQSRLLALVDMEMNVSPFWQGTADELERVLKGATSDVKTEASRLLCWNNACGTFLGRLAKDEPGRVEKVRSANSREWRIWPTLKQQADELL
jgi:hypothetical protein